MGSVVCVQCYVENVWWWCEKLCGVCGGVRCDIVGSVVCVASAMYRIYGGGVRSCVVCVIW